MIPGFLLTRQWFNDRDGIRLEFWLSTAAGARRVSIHQQKALFFISQADQLKAQGLVAKSPGVSIKPLELKRFNGDLVCAVYFDSQQRLYRTRDQLTQAGIACYESDIRPPERFLCERFITASIDVDSEADGEAGDREIHNVRLQPGEYRPNFEVMSVDIECDYQTDDLFSIAFISNQVKRVLMIGEGQDSDEIEYVPDERSLLQRWIEWVSKIDPDIFIGWNVVNFDLRLLQKKAKQTGLPLAIGRAGSLPVWRQSQADSSHHFILIQIGRAHV